MNKISKLNKCYESYFYGFSRYDVYGQSDPLTLIKIFCTLTSMMARASIETFKGKNPAEYMAESMMENINDLSTSAWYMLCFDALTDYDLQAFNMMTVMAKKANQEMLGKEVRSRMKTIGNFSRMVLEFAKYINKDPEFTDICNVYHILDTPEMRTYIQEIGNNAKEQGNTATSKLYKFYTDDIERREILSAYLYRWTPEDIRILSSMF